MALHHVPVRLASAPALLVHRDSAEEAGKRGTILFHHGLGAAKEGNAGDARSLADRGLLVALIDAVGHGERRTEDRNLGAIVRATAAEVPSVVDAMIERGLARADRLGIVGISMGGCVAYRAVLAERRLRAAVSIVGSPVSPGHDPTSAHLFPERFFPAAILSLNAGRDANVPAHHARDFHARLARCYESAPERQRYVEYPESGHFPSERDWRALWSETLGWIDRFVR